MAIFIPRGGSFTWGRSGLMRWGPPIDRRHSIGTRMAVVKDPIPIGMPNRFIGNNVAGRSQIVSFGTQFGGDFSFSFKLSTDKTTIHTVFCVVDGVDVWSRSVTPATGNITHWPFEIDVKNVPPQGVIRFDIDHTGIVRSGLRFDPVLSERMGAVQPQVYQPEFTAVPVEPNEPSFSADIDCGLDQTPPIRVISPSVSALVPGAGRA